MENGQAANWALYPSGSPSATSCLSRPLNRAAPAASPGNSPLSDSEILKQRRGGRPPLARGTDFTGVVLRKEKNEFHFRHCSGGGLSDLVKMVD